MTRLGPRGFTLVEVLVALTVTALVALLAGSVFSGVTDAAQRVEAARVALDQRMNARRWLTSTLLNLEVGLPGDHPFEGHPESLSFTTWQMVPGGWLERTTMRLGRSGHQLIAQSEGGKGLLLADSLATVGFDYLLTPGLETHWVEDWISPTSAPLAIRIRLTPLDPSTPGDTLLLLIKERG